MFLSIIIPAYNESSIIEDTLNKVNSFLSSKDFKSEIILINDGSTDDTKEIVTLYAKNNLNLKIIDLPHQGKGVAVKKGMLSSKGKWTFLCDADLSMSIDQLDKFLTEIQEDPSVDIIIANREHKKSNRFKEPKIRHYLGICFNAVVRTFILNNFYDTQCGFKLFKNSTTSKIFKIQRIKGFCFDVEILYLATKLNKKIKEIPVDWEYNTNSSVGIINGSVAFSDILLILIYRILRKYKI